MSPSSATGVRTTAGARRASVISAAVAQFARRGYWATPITDVADAAGISQAYVFRLFGTKLGLFLAALEHCFARIESTLSSASDASQASDPNQILSELGDAYARLISDRDLLLLQVHALSAADVPEIAEALRSGVARVTTLAKVRSGAADAAVQQFIALGQLCHLIVATGLTDETAPWASLLLSGMSHPTAADALVPRSA